MPDPIWCDVALSHLEVPVRLIDAGRARKAGPENVVCGAIDVLRATSTIVTALGNGCTGIHPCPSPDDAREKAAALRAKSGENSALLGGEQDAKPLEGFDGGNSPLEYTPDRIGGRRLVLSTSNGTKTLVAAGGCGNVFIVSFANMSAAVRRVAEELGHGANRTFLAACSGREGGYCEEDTAAAGLLIAGVREILGHPIRYRRRNRNEFPSRHRPSLVVEVAHHLAHQDDQRRVQSQGLHDRMFEARIRARGSISAPRCWGRRRAWKSD